MRGTFNRYDQGGLAGADGMVVHFDLNIRDGDLLRLSGSEPMLIEYRRVTGYVRSDGRMYDTPAPSAAPFDLSDPGSLGVRLLANDANYHLSVGLSYTVTIEYIWEGRTEVYRQFCTPQAPTTDLTINLADLAPGPNITATTAGLVATVLAAPSAADITDSGATGRALVQSNTQSAAWTALGSVPHANVWVPAVAPAKTAAYNASVGEVIPADATSGGFTITLPGSPAIGSQVWVKKIDSTANAVLVQRSGTDEFNQAGGPSAVQLRFGGQTVALRYDSGVWTVLSNSYGSPNLDARYTPKRATRILDINGKTVLAFTGTNNAVNYVRIANNIAVASPPIVSVEGPGPNIPLRLQPKSAAVENYTTSTFATWGVNGTAADIDANVTSKGAGVVKINGVQAADISSEQTFTNKVLMSPTIGVGANGYILDTSGNTVLQLGKPYSAAVNHLKIDNNQTGGGPIVSAVGSDTNIPLTLVAKGNSSILFYSGATLMAQIQTTGMKVGGAQVLVSGGALGTPASGNLTNCTFPTLNQNTTGTAAGLTTARNIDGQSFNGTVDITVIAPGTNAATAKSTPVDNDAMPLVDSASSNTLKKLLWSDLKATLKTYFDALTTTLSNKTLSAPAFTGTSSVATGGQFRFYNTSDQTTNYERLAARWSGNVAQIGTEIGGTGTSRLLQLGLGTGKVNIYPSSQLAATGTVNVSVNTGTPGASQQSVIGTLSASSGTQYGLSVSPTFNQSSTAGYSALHVNATQTATGSGTKRLIDAQVGGTSLFTVDNSGAVSVSGTTATIRAGTGTPEGAVTASAGSMFLRTDGGAGTTLYIKESGTGNTGWVAK